MREGWNEIALGEIVELGKGGSWGQDDQSADLIQAICLRGTDLAELIDRRIPEAPVRWIKESELRKSKCSKDMVLIETSGSKCGRSIVLTEEILAKFDLPVIYSNFCRTLSIDTKKVTREFVQIWFSQNYANGTIPSYRATSAMPNLDVKALLRVENIKVPPLPEQKRIVDLISSVDSYIGALQRQLETAKRSRDAVLHELLTTGGDDWVETTLGNVCDFINGDRGKNYPSAKFRQSHGIPFINAGHLDKGIVNFDSMDFISEGVFEKLGSGKVQPGDTLFCLRGSVGKFANVEDLQKGAIASSLVIIRPKSQITRDFLMHYLDSDLCSSELKQSLTGAVQPNLSANNLKSFRISLPTIGKQIEIGDLLGQFKSTITSLSLLLESTRNLRSGLLSDLLSGDHEIPASYDRVMGAA